jgi:hypothetical protein
VILEDLIPGLKAAVEREQKVREQSFLEYPETVCGVEVQPLTLRRMLLLLSIESPFICGGPVEPYDVGAFFVVLTDAKGFNKWRLLRRIGLMDSRQVVAGITEFMDETFQDKPPTSGGEAVSYYSFAAGLVDCLASEYGWAASETLDCPLKQLFQYLKAMAKRNNPKAIQFNPSDRVRGDYLKEFNANAGRN